jgi:hypothetical protein
MTLFLGYILRARALPSTLQREPWPSWSLQILLFQLGPWPYWSCLENLFHLSAHTRENISHHLVRVKVRVNSNEHI